MLGCCARGHFLGYKVGIAAFRTFLCAVWYVICRADPDRNAAITPMARRRVGNVMAAAEPSVRQFVMQGLGVNARQLSYNFPLCPSGYVRTGQGRCRIKETRLFGRLKTHYTAYVWRLVRHVNEKITLSAQIPDQTVYHAWRGDADCKKPARRAGQPEPD